MSTAAAPKQSARIASAAVAPVCSSFTAGTLPRIGAGRMRGEGRAAYTAVAFAARHIQRGGLVTVLGGCSAPRLEVHSPGVAGA
eukprot:CAMPEP_0179880058 /NCGR_PEP_ID=MMETSP0982-20121206/26564_1 /TAXON_ID=483367 /ORGANISM="non described non described, Strain CCMP 2436" /LENGTH=83 /DNA_ID=CAMNT_0021773585 /DNA_START=24 /DNA_END=275 /DNA_ORIENTATION=-